MSWRALEASVAAVAVLGFLGAAAVNAGTDDIADQGTYYLDRPVIHRCCMSGPDEIAGTDQPASRGR